MMESELLDFLKKYASWAYEDGAPEDDAHFNWRRVGLCTIGNWCGIDTAILRDAFREDGLDESTPFGRDNYIIRKEADTQHLCQFRKAWVLGYIAKHDEK